MDYKYCPLCAAELVYRQLFGRQRRQCPNCKWIHFKDPKVGVGALVEYEGKVVLVKRGVDPGKGLWCFPSGFMEFDETPQEAAVREFKEETGLDIDITDLIEVFYYNADFRGPGIMVLYQGEFVGGTPEARDDVVAVGFFGPNELPDDNAIAFQSNRVILGQWKQKNVRSRQRTREQAGRVQQILNSMRDGILLLDQHHCIELTNPAAEAHLALLTEAGVGDTLTHLAGYPLADILASPVGDPWHEVALTGSPRTTFEVVTQPIRYESETAGWVMVLRDVTKERGIQLRVQQQQRLAAVGQLAAGIAHDFNNILTSIIGFAELSRVHTSLHPSVKEDLGLIVKQGHRASKLIRQVLDFSGQSVAEKQSVNLALFVEDAVALLKRTIPEYIRIELDIQPGKYSLKADPTQIQQVLTNLAINARDAMPQGGELRLHLSPLTLDPDDDLPHPELHPGHWAVLSISDTGTGIPLEFQARLFEPFFTTKEVGEGSGLGLAQVYGIVHQHGGCIDVKSAVGQGATFTIYLPVSIAPRRTRPPKAQDDVPVGHGETILLVEDDETVLNVTEAMLKHLGYKVLVARNGQEALTVFSRRQDEVVLLVTDIAMPGMSGLALAEMLYKTNPAMKIIGISGYSLETEKDKITSEAIGEWLQKPLEFKKLAQAVSRVLAS